MDKDLLVKLYDEMIQETKDPVTLELDISKAEPVTYNKILTPNDRIFQNSQLPYALQIDVNGFHAFIMYFERIVEKYPQYMQNTGMILLGIFHATNSYFGTNKISEREEAYNLVEKDNFGMTTAKIGVLSKFEGNGSAKCSEKAATVHNLLAVLHRNGNLGNYEPQIVLSMVDGENHAFNILRDEKEKKTLFYDTSYLVKDKNNVLWCGLYSVSEEQYKNFMKGERIKPKLITPGTEGVDNGKREYGIGNEHIIENEL